jgi:hypothetical protein
MDNHDRRVRYVAQRYRAELAGLDASPLEAADRIVTGSYDRGEDATARLLTPAQRKRVRHKRGGTGAHRRAQREARKAVSWMAARRLLTTLPGIPKMAPFRAPEPERYPDGFSRSREAARRRARG